jgi:hypothetical protein
VLPDPLVYDCIVDSNYRLIFILFDLRLKETVDLLIAEGCTEEMFDDLGQLKGVVVVVGDQNCE